MRYASIRRLDISNGVGTGVSLFLQGCHFHCHNCFNKSTWSFKGGKPWDSIIEEQFFSLIEKPYIQRVSILGGEPLSEENLTDLLDLIVKIKTNFPNKKIWLYTGYIFEDIILSVFYEDDLIIGHESVLRKLIIENVDVLIDGPYEDSLKDQNLKWKGSANQRVIDVPTTVSQLNKNIDEFGIKLTDTQIRQLIKSSIELYCE